MTDVGMPSSKPMFTFSVRSGASCGDDVHVHVVSSGALSGSSNSPPSWLTCQEIAVAAVDLRTALCHGNPARLGVREAIFARCERPLAPRCDHLELGRQRLVTPARSAPGRCPCPCSRAPAALAPSRSATSTCCFAITGRASEVPSRYLCSYTAPRGRRGRRSRSGIRRADPRPRPCSAPVCIALSATAEVVALADVGDVRDDVAVVVLP